MSFTIPSSIPPPTDEELSDPDLLHVYFENNFADDPMFKDELERITANFVSTPYFDSYRAFSDLLAGEGIMCPVEWTLRAGGSGIYGSATAWTAKLSYTPSSPVAGANGTQGAEPIASTPFATPQSALEGLKTKLTAHYENTYKGLGQLLKPCERDGSVMLDVPNIVAGGFGIFTQAMIQGEQSAKLGLRDVLGNYVGLTGSERDGAVDALCGFYERVMTQALGPEWRASTDFQDYVARFKADGNDFVNVLGLDPFVNIEPSTFTFTRELFQKRPKAYAELQKIQDSVTYESIAEKVTEQRLYVSRALEKIASVETPDHLYDLIHNFANYGPARKYIYDYLGITEELVMAAQDQVGKTKWVRDPYDPKGRMLESVPDQKPDGMGEQTWALVSCLARRKNTIEAGETAFLVLSIGGSILTGIAAGTVAGVFSGGNPIVAGYAAATTAMATAGAIGTQQVLMVDHESEWAQGARSVAIFEHIPIGSSQMVAFLEDKKTYTIIAAGGNVVLAGLGAGTATAITQALSGKILKRIAVQALYGSLDGMTSVAIDGNVNNQERLTQATVLAGGKAEDAPTVTQVFFTAAVLGGVIGGTAEAVFNPGEIKIAMELATGKLKFYDAAGKLIPVKACAKVQGGVYKVTNTNGEVVYFRVNDQALGAAVTQPKVATQKPAPVKPKEKSTMPADAQGAAARLPDSFRTLSFADLPSERQASLRDIDDAYKKYGDEESLVMMPDGDVIPVPGKFDRAHSTAVKGEQGDGTVQRGRLLAHSQSDTIVPSAEDCRVFLAQAKDRPGEEFVTHITAHSKTSGGDPELLEVRIRYDPATESFDVQTKATPASMAELDQVDAAFEKAQKDFAKLSPDAQESARADMAAMPRIYASRFLSQDPRSAHCRTISFVNSLQHTLMQSGEPPLHKEQLEILETALWLTYFKNRKEIGKAEVNLQYPHPKAGFPQAQLSYTMTNIFKNLGMPVSCVETRLTKNFFSGSPLLSQGKETLTAQNNPFVAKALHMSKGQFLSPDRQMAASHSMAVSRFDPETGHLDVVDQLKVGKIETSNWKDISPQQGVELSFYGFYQESSDQLFKISDVIDSIDFSQLQKQNEAMAKELGYRG